jgi:hypothetical protein
VCTINWDKGMGLVKLDIFMIFTNLLLHNDPVTNYAPSLPHILLAELLLRPLWCGALNYETPGSKHIFLWWHPNKTGMVYRRLYFLSIYLSIYLSVYLSIHPSIYLSIYLCVCLQPACNQGQNPLEFYKIHMFSRLPKQTISEVFVCSIICVIV